VVVVTYLAGKLALCSRVSGDEGSPLARPGSLRYEGRRVCRRDPSTHKHRTV